MISPTPKVLTEADLAGLPRAVSLPPLPETQYQLYYEWPDDEDGYGGSEVVDGDAFTADQMKSYAAECCAAVVSERDALAGRVAELEAALWGCIAAIERTHHCTEADRLAAADKARAALSATTPESKP
ncbi:hypothetical protein [Hydrogenophaga sp.]|uniref:hypothetical protein n=1 Tax=Hydrogenophaga sp. TaxID=1904254 RepID=UPI0027290878|nr:hypothetical protein [Hydrogenophaga sp.]MDO9132009.1 hypothetical protein [Hydrogenophaga sp.]